MRKYLPVLAMAFVAVLFLNSCSLFKPASILNQEDVKELYDKAKEAFKDANVCEVTLSCKEHLSTTLGSITVIYKDAEDNKFYSITHTKGTEGWSDPTEELGMRHYEPTTIDKFIDAMPKSNETLYNNTIKIIPNIFNEAGIEDKYENFCLYEIKVSSFENKGLEKTFEIDCTKVGEASKSEYYGRSIHRTTTYYDLEFTYNSDSDIQFKD